MMSVKATSKPIPVKKALDATESADAAFNPTTSPGMTDLMVTPEAIDEAIDGDPLRASHVAMDREMIREMTLHGAEVTPQDPWQRGEYEPDEPDYDKEIQPESPEFLDIARDAIQVMKRGGWDPKTWQELILGLHRHMGVDAGYLDIQLTTHVGRTVLDQCGLVGMAPPEMMSFEFLTDPTRT